MSDVSEDDVDAHLADLDDGCGCVEMWAHTSEQRAADGADEESDRAEGGDESSE